jgi:quinol monooxygenase YgiN
MGEPISWHVELAVKPGGLDAFRSLTDEMVDATRKECGVLIYERFLSADEQTVYVYERYVDSDAAVAHLRAFKAAFGRRFGQLVERKRFTVFGSPTAELIAIFDEFGATYASLLAGFSKEP